ncbi:uncharacterized protein C5L36_0B00310 [Pichia kudriavzevii]|mgnify:FL=1|uniref:Phosphomutase PMU1 n=2 Tax=Pichia kudriavzevii TaxID=4909 RepID=A0A2U9R0F8_PICKU|nr:uncharacterized protein C5L36_0B00310 [Pichia kudriavzevii]AWU74764.1 hypothetical protein C5L36_0B00310 [Pichia kudriavzevii]
MFLPIWGIRGPPIIFVKFFSYKPDSFSIFSVYRNDELMESSSFNKKHKMSLISANATDKIDSLVPEEELRLFREKRQQSPRTWDFSVVPGFFHQSNPDTDDTVFNGPKVHFGLAKHSWSELVCDLKKLNEEAPEGVTYRLVFCARHGQGYHNVAVEEFGLKAWDDHYSHLNSAVTADGKELVWGPDPFLTEVGERQAKWMNELITEEMQHGFPTITKLYSSPFTRSLQTLTMTLDGIAMRKNSKEDGRWLTPLVVENLRETIGGHTCDKRSSKSIIQERFQGWNLKFEEGFQEEDVLWKPDWRESIHEIALRGDRFLQMMFDDTESSDIIYTTSHSGMIKALLMAANHRQFVVPTAGMIPMLVKGVRI